MMQGLLQYRNTPLQGVGLSPAQILLHRNLRDAIPALPGSYKMHKSWVVLAKLRLEARAQQQQTKLTEPEQQTLKPLSIGNKVLVQNKRIGKKNRWDRSGIVVQVKPNRQYEVQMECTGRRTLRNRRHLMVVSQGNDRLSARSRTARSLIRRDLPTKSSQSATNPNAPPVPRASIPDPESPSPDASLPSTSRLPRAFSHLLPHNSHCGNRYMQCLCQPFHLLLIVCVYYV